MEIMLFYLKFKQDQIVMKKELNLNPKKTKNTKNVKK